MTERKWQMMRLGTGDYSLLSNDRTVLWRIARYEEDGSAESGGRRLTGTFWALYKWRGKTLAAIVGWQQWLEWENWQEWAVTLPTRKAAVDAAMSYEPVASR